MYTYLVKLKTFLKRLLNCNFKLVFFGRVKKVTKIATTKRESI